MKMIKYRFETEVNYGTAEEPNIQKIFTDAMVPYSEKNLEFAKKEAYDGEIAIEDDLTIQEPEPTEMERIRADLDYLSVMTGVSL